MHLGDERVAAARVVRARLLQESRDLHRQRCGCLVLAELDERARLFEAQQCAVDRVAASAEQFEPVLDELQGNLRVVAIELDVRKQLVRPRRVLRVLGRFQDRERSACVARGLGRMVLQRVEPRVGPVGRAQNGVAQVRRRFEARERSCSAALKLFASMCAFARRMAKRDASTWSSRSSAEVSDSLKTAIDASSSSTIA